MPRKPGTPTKNYFICEVCDIKGVYRPRDATRTIADRTFILCAEHAQVWDASNGSLDLQTAIESLTGKLPSPAHQVLQQIQVRAETWSRHDYPKSRAHIAADRLKDAMREISDMCIVELRRAGLAFDIPTSAEVEADVSDSLRKPYTGPHSHDPRQA